MWYIVQFVRDSLSNLFFYIEPHAAGEAELSGWKSSLQKELWGPGGHQLEHKSGLNPCGPWHQQHCWQEQQKRSRGVIPPIWHLRVCIWSAISVALQEIWTPWSEPHRGLQVGLQCWVPPVWGESRRTGIVQHGNRKFLGHPTAASTYQIWGVQQQGQQTKVGTRK